MRIAGEDQQHNRQTRTADELHVPVRRVTKDLSGGGPMKHHEHEHMHHMHHALEMEKKQHEHAHEHMSHHLERHHKRHHDSQHGHDGHKHMY